MIRNWVISTLWCLSRSVVPGVRSAGGASQSTCDDDSQICSQLVKLFVSVEYNFCKFFSWVILQCLLTNWINPRRKKFHHKNCIFIAVIFIFIPRWFPVSACSVPALYCSLQRVMWVLQCCSHPASEVSQTGVLPGPGTGLRRTADCSDREPVCSGRQLQWLLQSRAQALLQAAGCCSDECTLMLTTLATRALS